MIIIISPPEQEEEPIYYKGICPKCGIGVACEKKDFIDPGPFSFRGPYIHCPNGACGRVIEKADCEWIWENEYEKYQNSQIKTYNKE